MPSDSYVEKIPFTLIDETRALLILFKIFDVFFQIHIAGIRGKNLRKNLCCGQQIKQEALIEQFH